MASSLHQMVRQSIKQYLPLIKGMFSNKKVTHIYLATNGTTKYEVTTWANSTSLFAVNRDDPTDVVDVTAGIPLSWRKLENVDTLIYKSGWIPFGRQSIVLVNHGLGTLDLDVMIVLKRTPPNSKVLYAIEGSVNGQGIHAEEVDLNSINIIVGEGSAFDIDPRVEEGFFKVTIKAIL